MYYIILTIQTPKLLLYIYTVAANVKISAACFNDPNLLGVSYFELNNISFYILLLLS